MVNSHQVGLYSTKSYRDFLYGNRSFSTTLVARNHQADDKLSAYVKNCAAIFSLRPY